MLGSIIAVGGYVLFFIVPRTVHFSYGSTMSCIPSLTLFPATYKTLDRSSYAVVMDGGVKWGNVPIVSTRTCVTARSSPEPGKHTVVTAPFGIPLYTVRLRVDVPPAPTAYAFDGVPVATTKQLIINLSDADVLFTYSLKGNGKVGVCKLRNGEKAIECDIPALELQQGENYTLLLQRTYKQDNYTTVTKASIKTLTATTVVDSSIKDGATVYDRPKQFSFTTDKKIVAAKVTIQSDDKKEKFDTVVSVDGQTITATTDRELGREKKYSITLDSVDAYDGSTLSSPYIVNFMVSGGPKVTGVSVGQAGIATNARITVTFDQEISDKQDITKFATISGGAARVQANGNQITYTLQGLGLCTPLTLSVAKGLESKYAVVSNSVWSYTTRTTCHTTTVYGYSVRGRALVSYNFGTSGTVTMYVGAIHGNESSSSGMMRAWIDYLEANPSLYADRRVVVVPTINPDGLAAGTRTNARGVNLNRNFPTDGWQKDIDDTDGYHAGGGGAEPLSEPESKALANFTVGLRPRLLLSFHAVGSLVTGDPGGYSAGYAARYASMVGYRNATGQSGTFDYSITGAYEDWTYAKQGIPSMVIELGSYGSYSFSHHRAALRAMLD